jgi:hypothetical protein
VREHLLAWQWSDYAAKHQDRGNLLLHIVAVPLFQLSTLALLSGAVTGALATAGLGALGMLVSIVAQGRGHRRERESPTPFAGAGDVLTRLVAEQWVTFPRFVVSGRWYRNLRGDTNPARRP